jgi:protein tyrosine/serine phosphatase
VLLNSLYNFHWVVPRRAARSAQPYLGFFGPYLRANGIKSVVNLRGRHPNFPWWKREVEVCEQAGIAHFDVMMDSRKLPKRETLINLFDAFDAAPEPLLIKCSGGQDRTSLASALYIVHKFGWEAMERAQVQFSRFPYLHFPREHQRWLSQFLIYARGEAADAPLADWARRDYDMASLARWLDGRGVKYVPR